MGWIDCPVAAQVASGALEGVEPQYVFFLGIGAMADEALVGENWQNSILPEDVLQRAREMEQEIEGETIAAINEGVLIQRLRRVDRR